MVGKPIDLTTHAVLSLKKRGASEAEVRAVIAETRWTAARDGRFEASKTFPYDRVWNGNPYRWKQVVPVFVEEPTRIVVITVYVFYR